MRKKQGAVMSQKKPKVVSATKAREIEARRKEPNVRMAVGLERKRGTGNCRTGSRLGKCQELRESGKGRRQCKDRRWETETAERDGAG